MTIENNSPRTIDELLKLKTYQGMSDEEIDMIILREKDISYSRGLSDAVTTKAYENVQKHTAACMDVVNKCMSMVKSLTKEDSTKDVGGIS